uniref:Reverse transcriptase domain-containing protein n=1 Tax=Monopterus albus TaxID=43700 RepID=A0A3Q3K5R8_MONAL
MIGDQSSSTAPLILGVPQGSILAPLLFLLYMSPLASIISSHNVSFHFYADDIQIYMPLVPPAFGALAALQNCIYDVKVWLAQNLLNLNEDKTEYIVISPHPAVTMSDLGTYASTCSNTVRNLGVIFDTNFNFDCQIKSVVKTSFYQLRLLAKVKPFLSRTDLEKAIHAFGMSRLDYCNALYAGLSQSSLSMLQLVQNAAAQLLTDTRRYAHITPILASLHWLPMKWRVQFKIVLYVFKALYGLAPAYLSDLLSRYLPRRSLRSSAHLALVVPSSRYKKWGGRAFAVYGPVLWNALPLDLRSITELVPFKSALKTYFFKQAFYS